MKTPLTRPELPEIERRISWPRAIAIFGSGADAFASHLASALRERGADPRVLRVELRHAEGFEQKDDVLSASPGALIDALESVRSDALTIGVGAPFALAVECSVVIHIRGNVRSLSLSLSPAQRALVARAHLVLEEPREGVAAALASLLEQASKRA